jgi:hypothetical protein
MNKTVATAKTTAVSGAIIIPSDADMDRTIVNSIFKDTATFLKKIGRNRLIDRYCKRTP